MLCVILQDHPAIDYMVRSIWCCMLCYIGKPYVICHVVLCSAIDYLKCLAAVRFDRRIFKRLALIQAEARALHWWSATAMAWHQPAILYGIVSVDFACFVDIVERVHSISQPCMAQRLLNLYVHWRCLLASHPNWLAAPWAVSPPARNTLMPGCLLVAHCRAPQPMCCP